MTEYEKRITEPPVSRCKWCDKRLPVPAWKYCSDKCMYNFHNNKSNTKAKARRRASRASTTPNTVSSSVSN